LSEGLVPTQGLGDRVRLITAKQAELTELGADVVCTFDQLAQAADVVVIDYVWGEPTGAIAGPEAVIAPPGCRSSAA
jgi:hypothetical protein